jgi:SAM-dependent methyltransferase
LTNVAKELRAEALTPAKLEARETAASGPTLELGCSVGRAAFELAAQTDELVLGIDTSFAMLRVAQSVLATGQVRYARRRTGLAYERREFTARVAHAERVDFWACDALALPFAPNQFAHVMSLNLLDSVGAPDALLKSVSRVLMPGGDAVVACPFDWSPAVTPLAGWIGGHSDRAEDRGSPTARLHYLLSDERADVGLRLLAERDTLPWTVRLHDRSYLTYDVHMFAAHKRVPPQSAGVME